MDGHAYSIELVLFYAYLAGTAANECWPPMDRYVTPKQGEGHQRPGGEHRSHRSARPVDYSSIRIERITRDSTYIYI